MRDKIIAAVKKWVWVFINPRFLLCFGLGWLITNGWSYIMFTIGTLYKIGWMIAVSSAYLAFLWLPISPEKLVTVAIAIFLLKRLFPKDEKTLGVLRELHAKARQKLTEHKKKKADKEKDNL